VVTAALTTIFENLGVGLIFAGLILLIVIWMELRK
jgi:hypothetical protein